LLSYFRINDPYRLIGLLVIMTVLSLPLFIDSPSLTYPELESFVIGEKVNEGNGLYTELLDNTPPLASWIYGACNWIFGRSLGARHILAFFILLIQSSFIGIMFIDKKVFSENTYIPSLLFSLLAFISFDSLALTSDLFAFGFILLVLNNLFKEIEFRIQRDEIIFNLGLFISLASLLNFSYAVYLPGAMLALALFTRSSLRKYLLLTFGFLLPHFLFVCAFYLYGNLPSLWFHFYVPNLRFSSPSLVSAGSLLTLCAMPLAYLFLSLFILNRDARLTKYQAQIFQAMFLWFVTAFVQVALTQDRRPQSLISLIPSVSFFLTHFLLLIRRRKFAEINLFVLASGIVTVAYLSRYDKISRIRYDGIFVRQEAPAIKNKRILVLDDKPALFAQNRLATPFYDWSLCKPIFEAPAYYENLLMVNRSIKKDLPDIIIDPGDLMKDFFDRLPELKAKYRKSAEGYAKIQN
jgi:hypothetical protein